jgi:tetratricopeptide (TPR) repeat protein
MDRRSRFSLPVFLFLVVTFSAATLRAQVFSSEQVQVAPPGGNSAAPSPSASVQQLELNGDLMRARKLYLDAMDYYQAALAKSPNNARIYNKTGIVELELQRYREAGRDFTHAIKAQHNFADAYNNLGVIDYLMKKNGRAVKQYKKAIQINGNSASFYSNLATAYFSQKEFVAATEAYAKAMQIDPDIFDHTSRNGVSGRISSPQDRAHYDYVLAALFAKMGNVDRSLAYLKRAMEEGYKNVENVYKDPEFATLRNDARFTELMASKPAAIPE